MHTYNLPSMAVNRLSPFISCLCSTHPTMSRYAPSTTDDSLFYHSVHSTPPRRPSAGVSRHDLLPLPALSRTRTESSAVSACSYRSHQGVDRDTSFPWPWHKPSADFDDREKMALVTDERHDLPIPSMRFWEGWRVVLLNSWFNILLFFLPAASDRPHTIIFAFCILSMIPLVKLHDLAVRELAMRLGGSKAGLLHASLSNIVELVIATTALRKCELRVVQSSRKRKVLMTSLFTYVSTVIGSMLSKLLLVLGMCFFAGGLRFAEQGFDATTTQVHSSLLSISVGAVLMPAAFHFSLSWRTETTQTDQKSAILKMSHGVSVVLVTVYCGYLLFQLWSHTYLFEDPEKTNRPAIGRPRLHQRLSQFRVPERSRESSAESSPGHLASTQACPQGLSHKRPLTSASDLSLPLASGTSTSLGYVYTRGTVTPAPTFGSTVKLVRDGRCTVTSLPSREELPSAPHVNLGESSILEHVGEDESGVVSGGKATALDAHEEEKPRLSWTLAFALLAFVTILVAANAEDLVESMDTLSGSISKEWVALILLPMMRCIAECLTAINVSRKDRLTLSISVAVGSTIQTALFVIPLMVILGWILGKPLPLLFDPFESIVLYISVHVMSYVVGDGKSNWLEGAILICFYINIAVSFWFYPGSTYSSTLGSCTVDLRR
ncbi:hypothetical protein F5148DRAFT_124274 [Russula earlei]|uniref:Uncharacterized protein n=1 Tax=Russula earlei TaxID=71964 RepID=A0ACC0ULF8_9AGAM|nr:hypothetical protein F5148DRAFT_124274 [Russula earlei]